MNPVSCPGNTRICIGFCLITCALVAGSAHAANATWNGTSSGAWLSDSNWSAAPAPGSGNTATFNNAGGGNTTLDLGTGVAIQQVIFDNTPGTVAAYIVGSGPAGSQTLTFHGGGVTMNGNVDKGQLFNAGLVLGTSAGNQSQTFTNHSTTHDLSFAGGITSTTGGVKTLTVTGAGNTVVSGAMTDGGGGTLALVKSGAGTLTLSGANGFTGGITVQRDGILRSGAADVLPAANITIAAGTLDLAGFNDTIGSGAGNAIWFYTTGGAFNLTNTISTGAGTLTLNGNIGVDSDARTMVNLISGKLNLGSATRSISNASYGGVGSTAQMTPIHISADISEDAMAGIASTNNGPAAMLRLSGDNSYTGITTIGSGYLQADSAMALGAGGDITFSNGVLQYTANSAGTDWAARFKNSGQPIRLDTNGQTVILAGSIGSSNIQGVSKLGGGSLIFSGGNVYSGTTAVNAGTLRSAASNVIPDTSTVMVSGNAAGVTATLDLNGNSDAIGALGFGGATATSGAAANTGDGVLTLGNNVSYDAANHPLGATLSGNLALGASTRVFTVGDSLTAPDDLTVSAAITGGAGVGLIKSGGGKLVLSGTNSYAGNTIADGGILQFDTLASLAGSGRNLTVTAPGAVALGYVPGTSIQSDLLNRIAAGSTGTVALTANTGENFDFSAGGPGNNFTGLSLGAAGDVTYSGTLTPNGTTYRLGGGGGTLTMANPIPGTGYSLVIGGNVILSTAGDFASTTINSGTLRLSSGAMTNLVNNGSVWFDFAGSQSHSGTISGSGSLNKSGGGTLTFTVPQTYAGTTTLNAGTLVLAAGDHTLNVNKPFVMGGGSTLDLESNGQYFGQISSGNTGDIITGTGGRLTLRTTAATGIAGSIQGSLDLVKSGVQTLALTGDNTTSGEILLLGGDLPQTQPASFNGIKLVDAGKLSGASGITLNHGTLAIDNTGSANDNDRVNDAATASLNGGRIIHSGRAATASAESLGQVFVSSGMATITATAGSGGSAELMLAGLTRETGATLRVDGNNLGAAGNNGRVRVTGAMTGNLAPVNGVVPGVIQAILGGEIHLAGHGATGFGAFGTAGFPAYTTGSLALAASTANFQGGGAVAGGGQTINALRLSTAVTFGGAADRLTIGSGMIVQGGGSSHGIGSAAIRGELTTGLGSGELFYFKTNEGSGGTPGANQINSVVTDHGGSPVKLVLTGFNRENLTNQIVNLTANNAHTGGTVVSGGNNMLLTAGSDGWTPVPAAADPALGLVIHNSAVTMVTHAQQIAASNIVTLTGGSLLTLTGPNNVLAGVVFNSFGGRGVPTVAGGAKLTVTGDISSTPTDPSVTPVIAVPVDLNGQTAANITVAPLPEGNFINHLTPLNGLQITSAISNGGIVKKGEGVLWLASSGNASVANTFSGQLTVEEGVINVGNTPNNDNTAGALGQSTLPVILGKAGGRTGTIEFTGGIATSSKKFTLAAGGAGGFQIDSAAANLTLGGAIGGGGGLVKTGPGTLTLSNAANTYVGDTTVAAGGLVLPDNAGLQFVVTDSSSNRITGSGTATLNGDFTIDTSAVGVGSGSWTLVDAATLNESFGATFTVAGAGWTQLSNVWTRVEGAKTWTFTEATGVLALTTSGDLTPFQIFMAAYPSIPAPDRDAEDDPDQDGVSNLGEFAFNGEPDNPSNTGAVHFELKDNGDPGGALELTFTCAMRRSATAFASNASNASNAQQSAALIDGLSYIVEGDSDLSGPWNSAVTSIGKSDFPPAGSSLPDLTGKAWEYRTFSGFDGLSAKGFIRARATMP